MIHFVKMSSDNNVIELNVGGVHYSCHRKTLICDKNSRLADIFADPSTSLLKDAKGRYFIDRDGVLFRFILVRTILKTLTPRE